MQENETTSTTMELCWLTLGHTLREGNTEKLPQNNTAQHLQK